MVKAGFAAAMVLAVVSHMALAQALDGSEKQLLQGVLMRGCLKRTPASDGVGQHSSEQVQAYCQCASQHLANDFSKEEVMGVLSGQIKKDDPRGKQKLDKATAACSKYLAPGH